MRYPASDKIEIIRLVEQSHLPVKRTLDKLGIARTTFYRWYDRYQTLGPDGLEDRDSRPGRVWNRIPDEVRQQVVDLALEETELSPRELAVMFTDTRSYFVSEASVYRLLKAHDLITSPAFMVIKAADAFTDKTTAPNQLWQTDFTYLKVIGWGWFYLSTRLWLDCNLPFGKCYLNFAVSEDHSAASNASLTKEDSLTQTRHAPALVSFGNSIRRYFLSGDSAIGVPTSIISFCNERRSITSSCSP